MSKSKKKPRKQHEIKERKHWEINPVEKVIPSKKKYDRKRDKKDKEYRV